MRIVVDKNSSADHAAMVLRAMPRSDSLRQKMYREMPQRGMVCSALAMGESFPRADHFDERWGCCSIAWNHGGQEVYRLTSRTVTLHSAGALMMGPTERYAYQAQSRTPFLSNMITFPHWIARAPRASLDDQENDGSRMLRTTLIDPDPITVNLMEQLAGACRDEAVDPESCVENMALLYARLTQHQRRADAISDKLCAVKPSTRNELARRVSWAQEFLLECYRQPELSIGDVANAACLSPYHLIRTFRAVTGQPPMAYLRAVRMAAAARLLRRRSIPVAELAILVGFRDRSAFSKAFGRAHGCPPSVYREQFD